MTMQINQVISKRLGARSQFAHRVAASVAVRFLFVALLASLVAITGCATNRSHHSIVGTWSEAGTATLLTFQADGMVKIITGGETTTGTYSFDPPGKLTLRFDGATPKPGPHRATCKLSGDRMQLDWAEGGNARYVRLSRE